MITDKGKIYIRKTEQNQAYFVTSPHSVTIEQIPVTRFNPWLFLKCILSFVVKFEKTPLSVCYCFRENFTAFLKKT